MDRRQRKTREAIFFAFTELLSKKDFNKISVGEIIDKADVGRATFYAHFETKDFLLSELCKELFCHVFDSAMKENNGHRHIFNCNAPDCVFLHLFIHLERNDNNVLKLLASQNNDLFLGYFKSNLKKLIASQIDAFNEGKVGKLPLDFQINHIASTFVETLRWWVDNGMKDSAETITEYFFLAVQGRS